MKKDWLVMKGVVFGAYLAVLVYAVLNNARLAAEDNLPPWLIPALAFASVIYFSWRYVALRFREGSLEYEFTTVVNHTFRTPITSLTWFAKELEKDPPEMEKRQYLQNMENALAKLLGIVDIFAGIRNVRDMSGYFFEATSLREIVEASIAKYREDINKKNLAFQVPTFKDIPLLTIDLKKIAFAVDTVIENAVMYTPAGGKILVDCISKNRHLTLYVSDTGLGLDWRDRMLIFSRFYRGRKARLANTDGMGLRLYLSREIVRRHRGRLYARSRGRDCGATVIMELPFR